MLPAKNIAFVTMSIFFLCQGDYSNAFDDFGFSNFLSTVTDGFLNRTPNKFSRSANANGDANGDDDFSSPSGPSSPSGGMLMLTDEERRHGVRMGVPSDGCDDAWTNLSVDWDGSAVNHTCYRPNRPIRPNKAVKAALQCETLAPDYYPKHFCMSKVLSYSAVIPTYGDHRPLWPKFGEYKFVPPQRWLHSVEHGSVVMLYHPCAHHQLVEELRSVLKGCIRKRVITPSDRLSLERPLALVAWGCKMEMAYVNKQEVIDFIRKRGLKGPEGRLPKQGQYTYGLLESAEIVEGSDEMDSVLCPDNI